jgi:hypothetical protein
MMTPIGIRDEEQLRSRKPWPGVAGRLSSRDTAERVPAVSGFGGRDGRDGGAVLEGAAAVERRPVPAACQHPARPGAIRPRPAAAPA